ncbi:MAG: hypothetical protein ACI91T_000204 [Natronomonas sp.]|jgi:hypothetical protein
MGSGLPTDSVGFGRRHWKRWLLAFVVTVLVVALFGLELAVTYFDTPHRGTDASVSRVEADPAVEVDRLGRGYVMRPAGRESTVGLVFYPGGRVHPDAYLSALAPLVREASVTVFVPKMPLNLAVIAPGTAGSIVREHPEIETWYVGGHSLGGSMACRYADGHADRVDGVVLLASYCDRDVSDASFRALSVTGSADRVLNRDRYRETRSNLPSDARFVRIRGMNHSQFGAYAGQRGGGPATIDYATAHDRLGDVLVSWIENGSSEGSIRRPRASKVPAPLTFPGRGPQRGVMAEGTELADGFGKSSPWPLFVALGLAISEVGVVMALLPITVGGLLLFVGSVAGILTETEYVDSPWPLLAGVAAVLVVLGAGIYLYTGAPLTVDTVLDTLAVGRTVAYRGLAIAMAGIVTVAVAVAGWIANASGAAVEP